MKNDEPLSMFGAGGHSVGLDAESRFRKPRCGFDELARARHF
jgi:hypothetical protein